MYSTVHGDFLAADETTIVLRHSLSLQVLVTVRAIPSIVMVPHRAAAIVAHEVVLRVVARAEELKGTWVRIVAHSTQDHVVALLQGTVAHILHCLDERQRSSVSSLGLFLQVHGQSLLVVQIVATPKAHGGDPENDELSTAAPDVWHLVEELVATLLTEVPVAEHRRVRVVVTDASGSLLHVHVEVRSELARTDIKVVK